MTGSSKGLRDTSVESAARFLAKRGPQRRISWPRTESRWRRAQAISLAMEGMSSPEIARITGLTRANVHQTCHRAGLKMATPEPKAARVTRAVMAVADGVSVVDAAIAEGLAAQALREVVRKRGVRTTAPIGRPPGRGDGRCRRAAHLVLFDGVSVREAADRYRVNPSCVYVIIGKIRKDLAR